MRGLVPPRLDSGRDALNALALAGQQTAGAIALGRGGAVGMAEDSANRFDMGGDARCIVGS
jgi:hypothetical protein